MSFQVCGNMVTLGLLQKEGTKKEQAESMAEAMIRHQDLGRAGMLSTIGV